MYKLKIKHYRRRKHLTQKELGKRIEMSRTYYCELENEVYDIRLSILYKIAKYLDVCPKDLIDCNCSKCSNRKNNTRL